MDATIQNHVFFNSAVLAGDYQLTQDTLYQLFDMLWFNLFPLVEPLFVSFLIMGLVVVTLAPLVWILKGFFSFLSQ